MKHSAISLLKFKKLQKELELPFFQVVGILESLWLFAIHHARDGDLTRFSDEDFAIWLEWDRVGNGMTIETLLEILVLTGWLDSEDGSFSIHDWNDHKPWWLKGAEASPRTKRTTSDTQVTHKCATSGSLASSSSSSSSSNGKVREGGPRGERKETKRPSYPAAFDRWWLAFPVLRRKDKPGTFKAWRRASEEVGQEVLQESAERYAASPEGQSEFVRGPARWLNSRGWEDDPRSWQRDERTHTDKVIGNFLASQRRPQYPLLENRDGNP